MLPFKRAGRCFHFYLLFHTRWPHTTIMQFHLLFAALALVVYHVDALGGVGIDRAAALGKGKAIAETTSAGSDDTLRLHVLRHGQTHANVLQYSQGAHEFGKWTTLTDEGREGAKQLGHRLASEGNFRTIYHSPQVRAKQTAEEIKKTLAGHGQHVELVPIHDLRDSDRGPHVNELSLEQLTRDRKAGVVYPGAETPEQMEQRLHRGVHHIIKASHGQSDVAYVGHTAGVSRIMADVFADAKKPYYIPSHWDSETSKRHIKIANTSHGVVALKPSKVADHLDKDGKLIYDPHSTHIEKWAEARKPDGSWDLPDWMVRH